MHLCLRIDVSKCHGMLVLSEKVSRYLTSDYFAEDAVHNSFHPRRYRSRLREVANMQWLPHLPLKFLELSFRDELQ